MPRFATSTASPATDMVPVLAKSLTLLAAAFCLLQEATQGRAYVTPSACQEPAADHSQAMTQLLKDCRVVARLDNPQRYNPRQQRRCAKMPHARTLRTITMSKIGGKTIVKESPAPAGVAGLSQHNWIGISGIIQHRSGGRRHVLNAMRIAHSFL